MNTECSFEPGRSGSAGFGEWIKTAPVWAIQENPRPAPNRFKERRLAGMTRSVTRKDGPQSVCDIEGLHMWGTVDSGEGPISLDEARSTRAEQNRG